MTEPRDTTADRETAGCHIGFHEPSRPPDRRCVTEFQEMRGGDAVAGVREAQIHQFIYVYILMLS